MVNVTKLNEGVWIVALCGGLEGNEKGSLRSSVCIIVSIAFISLQVVSSQAAVARTS